MKNLYKITLENKKGEIRVVEVAANNAIHAFDRLGDKISVCDKIKNYSCTALNSCYSSYGYDTENA